MSVEYIRVQFFNFWILDYTSKTKKLTSLCGIPSIYLNKSRAWSGNYHVSSFINIRHTPRNNRKYIFTFLYIKYDAKPLSTAQIDSLSNISRLTLELTNKSKLQQRLQQRSTKLTERKLLN